MEENYIHIYSTFIGELAEQEKITVEEVVTLLKLFAPVCEQIASRQQLVEFLDKHIPMYWELGTLKSRLLDSNYSFV